MTKEAAIEAATKIATEQGIPMAVCNDPISNNIEEEPDGPWGYCPQGKPETLLYRWSVEKIYINS